MPSETQPRRAVQESGLRCVQVALLASLGVFAAQRASAAALQLPSPALPAASSAPSLWFGPGELAALQARRTDPGARPFYLRFKAFVDARVTANLASQSDDTLSRLAKGAALLHQLGETTASGGSYRDLAVRALLQIEARTAPNVFGQGGNLNTQYDSGRLQSMAEALDLLRGTGVSASDLSAIEARIGNWADEFLRDPILQLRDNNLELKSGAALVTAALAMAGDRRAAGWLSTGQAMVNTSLQKMADDTGWYREGPHYTNYMLNNLLPAAYHVRNRTGVDWFQALRPLVELSLFGLRQPSGQQAPFEDAVPIVFPWVQIAEAYRGTLLAETCLWAWENSDQNTSNFGVQQLADATTFLVYPTGLVPVTPFEPPTFFAGGEAHLLALRSGYDRDALQATLVTGIDHSSLTLLSSRHNVQNPLELTLAGLGADLLVAGSGGPQITQSTQRAIYLSAPNHGTVLVNGQAPFTAISTAVTDGPRLRSEGTGGLAHDLLDLGSTEVTGYTGANRVGRTVALVDGAYVVCVEDVAAPNPVALGVPWRGRGARRVRMQTPDRIEVEWTQAAGGGGAGTTLSATSVGSAPLTLATPTGLYASRYGQEETIEVARVELRVQQGRLLTVLQARATGTPTPDVQRVGSAGLAAVQVTLASGAQDVIAAGAVGQPHGGGAVPYTDAAFVLRRRAASGALLGLAADRARFIDDGSLRRVEASAPLTFALTITGSGTVVTVSSDQPATQVVLRGVISTTPHAAYWNGVRLSSASYEQRGADVTIAVPTGGGTLLLSPDPNGGGGTTGGSTQGTAGSGGGSGGGGCVAETDGGPLGAVWPLLALAALLALAGRARSPKTARLDRRDARPH